jgi:ABC-type Mn2+/Zn2+ transport system permease subunit
LLGGALSFIGFCLAYRYDLPVGPADVVLLGAVYGVAFLAKKGVGLFKTKRATGTPRAV